MYFCCGVVSFGNLKMRGRLKSFLVVEEGGVFRENSGDWSISSKREVVGINF